jgi:hypothetical protein
VAAGHCQGRTARRCPDCITSSSAWHRCSRPAAPLRLRCRRPRNRRRASQPPLGRYRAQVSAAVADRVQQPETDVLALCCHASTTSDSRVYRWSCGSLGWISLFRTQVTASGPSPFSAASWWQGGQPLLVVGSADGSRVKLDRLSRLVERIDWRQRLAAASAFRCPHQHPSHAAPAMAGAQPHFGSCRQADRSPRLLITDASAS